MPCQESFADAKASFVSAVSDGIAALMNQCGYSRDRATFALTRELNRGQPVRPSDKEIFEVMERHNIGIEEASKTILISKALKRAMVSRSPAEAIELLASQISLRNLMYDSSDEDPASDDDIAIRPELRIEPVSTNERQSSSRRKTNGTRKPRAHPKPGRSRTKTPSRTSQAGRKRSIEEMTPSDKRESETLKSRERADSVTSEVDAKMKQQNEDESSNGETAQRSAPVTRAKRSHRTDETDPMLANSHKRMRATDA